MAVGEKRSTWLISQVSWTDWTSQDVYYWLEHSFQYAANINADDEMHGIKLAQKATYASWFCPKCQLVSCGSNWVMALRVDWEARPIIFDHNNFGTGTSKWEKPNTNNRVCPWVVFQDYFWYWISTQQWFTGLSRISNTWAWSEQVFAPCDHPDYTDEDISNPDTAIHWEWAAGSMNGEVTAILNYNNTRLVVAVQSPSAEVWVYYPELDKWVVWESAVFAGRTWWKKVMDFEAWSTIVAMTCTFEYLKIWVVDEWWNTKVYYYQGNNNLRSTFVYNVIDLTGVRVTRVYPINWIDYYTASIDWTDWFVTLYKMVWNTPLELFHVRWWLDPLDVNYKAPYFVWPCSLEAAYNMWRFYIADAYGLFQFKYNPQGYDKGYMKWHMRDQNKDISSLTNGVQPYWVCYNQWYLYVSDSNWCWKIRCYDTGKDWYDNTYKWVLISREYEWKEWGTITKMLDEVRLNYELNPANSVWSNTWTIDIYVSPNNTWDSTSTFTEWHWWYHVMHIDSTNKNTRTEKSNLFNDMGSGSVSSFKFDWQTITYAIVIQQNTSTHATPIVRQIDIKYHTKDKVNNVYDIN